MRITILSTVPESFGSFRSSHVVSRASSAGAAQLEVVDIRDYAEGSYRKIDDSPYGGGPGMVLRVDTVHKAITAVRTDGSHVVLLSPKGVRFNRKKAREFAGLDPLVLVCGHYEGFDERVRRYVDEEISMGDFILTGGEIPAMAVCDSVLRLLDGSLREGSADDESFETGLLEYPQYTHPFEYNGDRVPEVLLSGNDAQIESWRRIQAVIQTIRRRPDLFGSMPCQSIGLSGDKVIMFDNSVLKIRKTSPESEREVSAMKWLEGKLPVPHVICHEDRDGFSYLLMSRVRGRMLCDGRILHNRNRLMKSAAAALKMLWSVDISDCPFLEEGKGNPEAVLCHGDLCLPNIFADNDGITGFIDLGNCTVGERRVDLDTLMESLDANLVGRYSDGTETEALDRNAFLKLVSG